MSNQTHHGIETLMREHGPFLQRLARALTADQASADDLVHDTWLSALQQPSGSTMSARGWLATVLRRRAAALRRRLTPELGHAQLGPASGDQPDRIAEHLEREQLVNRALASLAEPYRTVLFLRYHEGLTPTAIARRTGTPVKTVKTRLGRGLEQVRRALDAEMSRRGADDPRAEWLGALAPLGAGAAGVSITSAIIMKKALSIAAAIILVGAVVVGAVQLGGGTPAGTDPEATAAQRDSVLEDVDDRSAPDVELVAAGPRTGSERVPAPTVMDGTATVTVTVVDATGRPAPHHTIRAKRTSTDGSPQASTIGTTDSKGQVTFIELEPGRFYIREARGLGRLGITLEPGVHATARLEIKPAIRVHGVVHMRDGRPARAATIWGSHSSPGLFVPIGSTNGDGTFDLNASSELEIQATLPGALPSFCYEVSNLVETAEGVRSVEMTLGDPGATLSGRIIDEAGQPIVSARITAGPRERAQTRGGPALLPLPISATTESDGRFFYAQDLPDGRHEVVVTAPGYATTTRSIEFDGVPVDLEITMTPGGTIEGRATLPDGRPAVNADVALIGDPSKRYDTRGPAHNVQTDDAGRFVLRRVPVGDVVLCAESGWEDPLARSIVTIRAIAVGETRTIAIRLSDRPMIAGQVVDKTGLPLQSIRIEANEKGGDRTMRMIETDVAGHFRVTAIEPRPGGRATWTISAWTRSRGGSNLLGKVEGVPLGTLDVRLVIDRPVPADAFINGRITNAGRRIPADMDFILWKEGQNSGPFLDVDAATGVFEHGPIVPGTYRIEARRFDLTIASLPGVVVGAGETVQAPDIPVDIGGDIEVTFRSAGGSRALQSATMDQLHGAWITVRRTNSGQVVRLVEQDDVWVRRELPTGTYTLELKDGGDLTLMPTTIEVLAHETTKVVAEIQEQ